MPLITNFEVVISTSMWKASILCRSYRGISANSWHNNASSDSEQMMKSFTITLLRGFCPKAYCLSATHLLSEFLRHHFKNFFLVYFCVWGTLLASATCRAPPIIHYLSKGFLWCIIDNLIMYHISKVHEPACCYLIVSMFHLVWRGMKTKFFHYHYFLLLYDYF